MDNANVFCFGGKIWTKHQDSISTQRTLHTFNLQIHCTVVYLTYSGTYNTYTFYIHKYIAKQYGYLALNREQSEFYPGGHHK